MRRAVAAALLLASLTPAAAAAASRDSVTEIVQLQRTATLMARAIAEIPDDERIASDRYLLEGPLARLRDLVPYTALLRTPGSQRVRAAGEDSLDADREAMRDFWYNEAAPPLALRNRLQARMSAARFDSLDDHVETLEDFDLDRARGVYRARLARFEAKYGPGAPSLNVFEAGLNLLFQDHFPLKPNRDGPSPNEILLGYSTSYFVVVDDKARALSVLEVGLRRYRLDWVAADAGVAGGLLRPRYWSAGLAVAAEEDGALRWPLDVGSDPSLGPFLSWGDLKVAYFFGAQHRFAVSRRLHLVPGLF